MRKAFVRPSSPGAPVVETGAAPAGNPPSTRASLALQPSDDLGLVDLLDRVLEAGVVVSGDVVLSLADVDLVYLNLRLLLGSVETLRPGGSGRGAAGS
jgi:hypothetical protein